MSCRSISSSEIVAFEVEADGKLRAADGALAIYIKERKRKKMCLIKHLDYDIKDVLQRGLTYFPNEYTNMHLIVKDNVKQLSDKNSGNYFQLRKEDIHTFPEISIPISSRT